MTGRGLSQAVHPKAEPDAPRGVAAEEGGADAMGAIGSRARAVEAAGPEAMALMATVPDPRIGAIAVPGGEEPGDGSGTDALREAEPG